MIIIYSAVWDTYSYYIFCYLQDAFIVDTGCDVVVWVGANASSAEKKCGLQYAHVSLW